MFTPIAKQIVQRNQKIFCNNFFKFWQKNQWFQNIKQFRNLSHSNKIDRTTIFCRKKLDTMADTIETDSEEGICLGVAADGEERESAWV
jgi:hypothetical protein